MSKSLIDKKGFTLIEAIIAIFVLSVGLFTIVQFFPFGLKIVGDARERATASALAQEKIEELRNINYEDIATGIIEPKQRISVDPTDYLYRFSRQTEVALIDNEFAPTVTDVGFKKIDVTIYWETAIGHSEASITMFSTASRY